MLCGLYGCASYFVCLAIFFCLLRHPSTICPLLSLYHYLTTCTLALSLRPPAPSYIFSYTDPLPLETLFLFFPSFCGQKIGWFFFFPNLHLSFDELGKHSSNLNVSVHTHAGRARSEDNHSSLILKLSPIHLFLYYDFCLKKWFYHLRCWRAKPQCLLMKNGLI